jgi:hypothetical protein
MFEWMGLGVFCANAIEAMAAKGHTMSYQLLAAAEFGEFLHALANPRRIKVLEELRIGPIDRRSMGPDRFV